MECLVGIDVVERLEWIECEKDGTRVRVDLRGPGTNAERF